MVANKSIKIKTNFQFLKSAFLKFHLFQKLHPKPAVALQNIFGVPSLADARHSRALPKLEWQQNNIRMAADKFKIAAGGQE